jgi:hypothetical protein
MAAWPPVAPACEVDRVAPTLRLKERHEPAKWLNDFLGAEPCMVELARPSYMYWALFMPVSDMAATPEAIALFGERTRASLQLVVGRGADVNAVATLRCIGIRGATLGGERTTVLGLMRRRQQFIEAQGKENLKPIVEYLRGLTDLLQNLGAQELPPPPAAASGEAPWLLAWSPQPAAQAAAP